MTKMPAAAAGVAFFASMELVLTVVALVLTCVYAGLLGLYGKGWRDLPEWDFPPDFTPSLPITVVIPARNEAAQIGACLEAILGGAYPPDLLEILVVDDHSEDATPQVVRAFCSRYAVVRLLSLAENVDVQEGGQAFKKKALAFGLGQATGAIIVTTDADCRAGKQWLQLIASVFETRPAVQLLTAPVAFHREPGWFQRFQALDFLGMMGVTGAGIHYRFQRMGNGANLAYRKKVFDEMNGYAGSTGRASGDDMFLIQQVAARYPQGIFFLKNRAATVYTEAKPDLRSFLQQRLRWGAKNAALPEWPIRLALGAVFLFCWSMLINALILPWIPGAWPLLVFQLTCKAAADFLFLRMLCRYFGRLDLLRGFWPSLFLHTFYIAVVGAGSLFFKDFDWKGRRVR